MASATATALAPYQPPDGLAPREILAHARDHIDKLQKKHEALKGTMARTKQVVVKHTKTITQSALAVAASGSIGLVNGRYGGDKGYWAPWGIPADLTVAGAAHVVGLATYLLLDDDGVIDPVSEILHTIGDAALSVGVYRMAHQKGVELAAKKAAAATSGTGANANGARGGMVYSVAPPAAK